MTQLAEGFHADIPFEQYTAAQCVNNSLLKEVLRSPAHAVEYRVHGDDDETNADIIGRAFHTAVLEPELLEKRFRIVPQGLKLSTKAGIAWKEENEGFDRLTFDESQNVRGMAAAVRRHPACEPIFRSGTNELSIFVKDQETGLLLKGRVDRDPPGNAIVDFKSTVDATMFSFSKAVAKYKYHMQAAFYLDLYKRLGVEKTAFIFVAIEKKPPYAIGMYQLDDLSIQKGREEYQRALALYANCVAEGKWPPYGSQTNYSKKIEIIGIPHWAHKAQFEEDEEAA